MFRRDLWSSVGGALRRNEFTSLSDLPPDTQASRSWQEYVAGQSTGDPPRPESDRRRIGMLGDLERATTDRLRSEPRRLSGAFGALEAVLDELQDDLGADPALPMLREAVDRTGAELAELCAQAATLFGPVDVQHLDANVLVNLRVLIRK